ncbi:MAG: aminoacyl-tRNA hydrolase, partial [Candidatus Cloacimonetes bacterium]|nr:aminoacyl-tRNA hydrolase [Candidatus Cloacimonadota bacterium]
MKLVVGLGNPGDQYQYNRHNIGFLQLDNYCREHGLIFTKKPNYFLVKQGEAIFLKPRTFMNRSGLAVKAMLTKYPIRDILVVVDDIYLP